MQTASESWPERVMNRLRSSTDEGLDILSFDARRILLSLLLGLIGGLILGLFLGWSVWPVQWTNTQPVHLEPDAKAQYIAAVADAYVATGGDPVALETARMRLINIDDADFASARTYFANTLPGSGKAQNPDLESPSVFRDYAEQNRLSFDSNIRLNNINQLATSLGLSIDTNLSTNGSLAEPVSNQLPQVNPQPIDSAAQTVEQTTDQSISGTSPDAATPDLTGGFFVNGLGRAVACLTALMLVLGGVYILVRLNQRMKWLERPLDRMRGLGGRGLGHDDMDRDEFDDEGYGQDEVGARMSRASRSQGGRYRGERAGVPLDPELVHADTELDAPHGFDFDDELDDYEREPARYRANDYREPDYSESEQYQRPRSEEDAIEAADRYTDIGPAALTAKMPTAAALPAPASSPSPAQPTARRSAPKPADTDVFPAGEEISVDVGTKQWDDEMDTPASPKAYAEPPDFDDNLWPTAAPAPQSMDTADAMMPVADESLERTNSGRARARTRRTVLEHTATYRRGERADYEEKHQIFVDDDGMENLGRNVGECGVGVNFKNGILLDNPHDIIALDVWLFDKVELEMLTSVKRILISEYVIERGLVDVIQRENHSDGEPIVPQPGTEFELSGANLSLSCRVVEASYMQEGEQIGIFDTVTIQMTVYANV